jgi:alpha-galactosidase/6-phospho-beta-glucosidase family protein
MAFREDYQAMMEKQLNEWKAQTERFKTGMAQMEMHAKEQFEKNLEVLRTKQSEAWDYFYKMKSANENAWSQFQGHMDKAGGEVKAAIENMGSIFKR